MNPFRNFLPHLENMEVRGTMSIIMERCFKENVLNANKAFLIFSPYIRISHYKAFQYDCCFKVLSTRELSHFSHHKWPYFWNDYLSILFSYSRNVNSFKHSKAYLGIGFLFGTIFPHVITHSVSIWRRIYLFHINHIFTIRTIPHPFWDLSAI